MPNSAANAINLRIFRTMVLVTGLSVAISAFVGPWRVTTGLLAGGLLALFSHRWLKNSAAAAIRLSAEGGRPELRLTQFFLRYLVIGAVIFSAYTLALINLPAVFAGLSSFVVALFVEAIREFYFAFIEREETS